MTRYPQFPGCMSVTEVISASGLIAGTQYISDWYLNRGSAVHLATALYDKGTLDETTVDPAIAGALASWKRYREVYTPTHIELSLSDPIYKLCGTMDRLPLADIKGPNKSAWQRAQLSGYWHLCRVNNLGMYCDNPHTVHLDPSGGMPKLHHYSISEMRESSKELLTLLAALRIKERYMKG